MLIMTSLQCECMMHISKIMLHFEFPKRSVVINLLRLIPYATFCLASVSLVGKSQVTFYWGSISQVLKPWCNKHQVPVDLEKTSENTLYHIARDMDYQTERYVLTRSKILT